MKKSIVILSLAATLLFAGCQQQKTDNNSKTSSNNQNTTVDTTNVQTTPEQLQGPQKGDTVATIETDLGIIKFKLFTDKAPETSKNFIELAKAGKFNNVPFHRVIEGFMIQTGDFTNKNGTGGYSYKGPGTNIDNEISPSLKHLKGTVSMANAGPNTNGSQFFIVTADKGTPYLDGSYSVFGQVYEGQDVADAISKVKTGAMDKPVQEVDMKNVTISTY
jgi:cyclophilin family peptidyl-prolyl cis-trans isomerase